MRKKRSSEKSPQPEPEKTPVMASEPNRRPSRRAAVEAAKKIYNSAHNYDVNGTDEAPPHASEQKSKKKREDISLEMLCEDEGLSPVQNRFQREAIEFYNLTMRNLRQLQACNNVRVIEERPNQANVRKTYSAKPKNTPLSKSWMANLVNKKSKNAQNGTTQIIYV